MHLQRLFNDFAAFWIRCNQIRDNMTLENYEDNSIERELDIACNRFLNEFIPLSVEDKKLFYNYLYSLKMLLEARRDELLDNGSRLSQEDEYKLMIIDKTMNYVKTSLWQKEEEKNLVKLIKQL